MMRFSPFSVMSQTGDGGGGCAELAAVGAESESVPERLINP